MNLYEEFYPLVVEMLDEFGAAATLVSSAPAAPTTVAKRTGRAATSGTAQGRPVRAAVTALEVRGDQGRLERRSVATMLLEPREGDTLRMGDQTWTIGTVTKVAPQGKAIVFMAEVS